MTSHTAAAPPAQRALRLAAAVYGAGLVLHGLDHLRRGLDQLTEHVFWLGNVSSVIGVVTVALVLTGHRWGPFAAASVGLPTALGVAAVHLPPDWGALSDSLVDGHVDGWTYAAVAVEIAGAAALGVTGLLALRRTSGGAGATGAAGPREPAPATAP